MDFFTPSAWQDRHRAAGCDVLCGFRTQFIGDCLARYNIGVRSCGSIPSGFKLTVNPTVTRTVVLVCYSSATGDVDRVGLEVGFLTF